MERFNIKKLNHIPERTTVGRSNDTEDIYVPDAEIYMLHSK
jgi:hypothetical protein